MQMITLTEEQRQKANAKAVRERLYYSKPKAKPLLTSQEVKSEIVNFSKMPLWKKERIRFDEHVKAWEREQLERYANPALHYLKRRCRELKVSYKIIIGPCRKHESVEPRHLLMWEIRYRYGLSYPAIGRLFGDRDHSVSILAVRKMNGRYGEPL